MKTITVVGVEGRRDNALVVKAIKATQACLPCPSSSLLLSPLPPHPLSIVEWYEIPDFGPLSPDAVHGLDKVYLSTLPSLARTDFAILVHADGYAVNPDAWTDEFLEYDFIGAPWPIWLSLAMFTARRGMRPHRVGCGGFSLRSQKWLEACEDLPRPDVGEDIFMQARRDHFTHRGCRIAPISLALRWAVEYRLEDYPLWDHRNSFGIHGIQPGGVLWNLGYVAAFRLLLNTSRRNKSLWHHS